MKPDDTIAAFASPVLPGGRIVLRVSGAGAHAAARAICPEHCCDDRSARQRMLDCRGYRFPAWVYSFVGPRSYTGEDGVELHLPGNPLLAQALLATLLENGVRSAEPGEFTARAFFNGKLDLTEAEGVAAVIAAADSASLRSARQLLGGELARRLRPATDRLSHTLALVEAEIDFSEEDISFLPVNALRSAIVQTRADLRTLLNTAGRLRTMSHAPTIAVVGRPNAGKSTLVNALAGHARSVVSEQAGTTRDVLSVTLKLPGGPVTLLDVAGIEPVVRHGSEMDQAIAAAMQRRAATAAATADHVVLVRAADDDRPPVELELELDPDLVVISKADLGGSGGVKGIHVSAHTGLGLDALRASLNRLTTATAAGDALVLNQRHEKNVADAIASLDRAEADLPANRAELVAAELRRALDALGSVLGAVTPDDILGQIFVTFCIGK